MHLIIMMSHAKSLYQVDVVGISLKDNEKIYIRRRKMRKQTIKIFNKGFNLCWFSISNDGFEILINSSIIGTTKA